MKSFCLLEIKFIRVRLIYVYYLRRYYAQTGLLRIVYDTAVYDTKISDNAECTVGIDYDELSEFDGKRIMKKNYAVVNSNEFS